MLGDVEAVAGALALLSPGESRAARRRFRKLWRKLAQSGGSRRGSPSFIERRRTDMGYGCSEPTKRHKTTRKTEVLLEVQRRVDAALSKIRARDLAGENPG